MADHSTLDAAPPPTGPPRSHLLIVGLIALGTVILVAGIATLLLRSAASLGRAQGELPPVVDGGTDEAKVPAPRVQRDRARRRDAPGQRIRIDRLARQVARIRGLPLREPLRSRALSSRALADKISDLAFSEADPEQVEADERLLVALRLAEPDFDLAAVSEQLYREQVLGVYVPEEGRLYVRKRGRASPAQQTTTAHEITHALQDQSFDIDRLQKRYEDRADSALAVLSLVEGDATLTQQLWAQEHLSAEELEEAFGDNSAGGSALDDAPSYLRASLFFPYAKGGAFVAALYREGGTQAIDAAFQDPPLTSEQILHPERYTERDDPVTVKVRTTPGRGWQRSARYQFGEFDVRELLRPLGADTAEAAAAGWDGGDIRSWTKGAGTAVAAVMAFDTQSDADEVCAALPDWYARVADGRSTGDQTLRGDRDAFAFRCNGDSVSFGLAPAPQTAWKLAGPP